MKGRAVCFVVGTILFLASCRTGQVAGRDTGTGKDDLATRVEQTGDIGDGGNGTDNDRSQQQGDTQVTVPGEDALPEGFNLRFVGFDADITDPAQDRRCYYKLFIDKAEEGRTTTGLESQRKVYEAQLSADRHLLMVEKWVLDEKEGKYVKLNNIDQPKPNFVYFDITEKKGVIIIMKAAADGAATFDIEMP